MAISHLKTCMVMILLFLFFILCLVNLDYLNISLILSLSLSLCFCLLLCVWLPALQGRDPPGISGLSCTHLNQSSTCVLPCNHLLVFKVGPELQSLPECCLTVVVFTVPLCKSLFPVYLLKISNVSLLVRRTA